MLKDSEKDFRVFVILLAIYVILYIVYGILGKSSFPYAVQRARERAEEEEWVSRLNAQSEFYKQMLNYFFYLEKMNAMFLEDMRGGHSHVKK